MQTWSELPLLLMDKIMRQLHTRNLVRLRLVCKSWKAACTEFCGSAVGRIKHQQGMLTFCAALPNLSRLALTNRAANFDLSPLAALLNLEDMALYHRSRDPYKGPAPCLDFLYLPPSLRKLTVSCFDFIASGFSTRGSFAGLTSLVLIWRLGDSDTMTAMWGLLAFMPHLKVHHPFGCSPHLACFTLDRRILDHAVMLRA